MMPFAFCPLRSGSSGNVSFVMAGQTRLLIDAGLSGRAIQGLLNEIGAAAEGLHGILITHEHSDHIKGVGVLSRRFNLPVYANEGTWNAMAQKADARQIATHNQRVFTTGEDFYLGDLGIQAFPIPHDAAEPVGYTLQYRGHKLAVATDIGHIAEGWLTQVRDADLLLLESNHDPDMLSRCDYPAILKRRILGKRGHLSNEDCGEAVIQLTQAGLKHVILGHLSERTNMPDLALNTVRGTLDAAGIRAGQDIRVDMAWRDRLGGFYTIMA